MNYQSNISHQSQSDGSQSSANTLMNASNSSLTQMHIDKECKNSLKPRNLIEIINEECKDNNNDNMEQDDDDDTKSDESLEIIRDINTIIDIQNNLVIKIRLHELQHYKQMDIILSKYWMWSWIDFIFTNRKCIKIENQYIIYGTGNISFKQLTLKKKEIYKCFNDFQMDFDEIIEFRGYSLNYKQIETYLSDCINMGFSYNWKNIHNSIFKSSKYYKTDMNHQLFLNVFNLNENDCGLNEFYIDFILLQIKIIELVQKQLNDIFIKFPNAKKELFKYYDDEGLNPNKLQKATKNNKNLQNINNLIPKDYEMKLKKVKVIYDDIWMLIKLKPIRLELIHFFLKQEEIFKDYKTNNNYIKNKDYMKIDLSLIRYSLIRMIVFHIKRVVWMKHFIFH